MSTFGSVKSANRQVVLEQLRGQNLISRTRIAEETGLSKATVTRILGQMILEGLVEEVRTTEGGIGRPHILLHLMPRARYAVGIELTAALGRVVLTDMNAQPLKQRILPVTRGEASQVIGQLAAGVADVCRDVPASQLVGAGVAVPGIVDSRTGTVNLDYPAGWHDIPLAASLSQLTGLRATVVNRAHAAAWGEKWYGAGRQVSDLIYIRLGAIVEAGLIINDRLHSGKTFTAGAIGHISLDPHGAPCSCGNRGCLNTFASTPALLAKARALLKDRQTGFLLGTVEGNPALLTLDHLVRALQAGDGLAVQVFGDVGRATGAVIAILLNFLNPERVIIGGPLSVAGAALLSPLLAEVRQRALPSSLVAVQIEPTRLGADAAAVGAASLVLQHIPDNLTR